MVQIILSLQIVIYLAIGLQGALLEECKSPTLLLYIPKLLCILRNKKFNVLKKYRPIKFILVPLPSRNNCIRKNWTSDGSNYCHRLTREIMRLRSFCSMKDMESMTKKQILALHEQHSSPSDFVGTSELVELCKHIKVCDIRGLVRCFQIVPRYSTKSVLQNFTLENLPIITTN